MSGRESFLGGRACGENPRASTVARKEDSSEYADDCAIMYPSRAQCEKYVPLIVAHFRVFGLEVHVGERGSAAGSKSEVGFFAAAYRTYAHVNTSVSPPIFEHEDGELADFSDILVGERNAVPVVFKFVYLGSVVATVCSDDADVDRRVSKASAAFGRLHMRVFASTEVTWHAKRTVHKQGTCTAHTAVRV